MTTKEKTLRNESIERYDVSIIVPTYNRSEYIRECIDSLLEQTRPAFEIIVIDDGSEDNTAEIIHDYGNKVRYVHKENGGKPSAVNLGLSMVQGNLIWIFDDDDVALPDAIESRVATLKKNKHAGLVYTPHFIGSSEQGGKIVRGQLYLPPLYDDDNFFYFLLKGCFFHLASALVRIEAYQEVGRFDENLFSSEDYDMQIRLARKFNAVYCSSPSFIFRQHSGVRGAKAISYAGDQRSKIFRKYDQKIGLKLRQELSLNEYLIPKTKETISTSQVRDALLCRMVVMASKGCVEQMFEDLNEALRTLHDTPSELNELDLQLISSTITTGYAYDVIRNDWPTFKLLIMELKQNVAAASALRALAKGFFILAKSYPDTIPERLYKLFLFAKVLFLIIKG